MVQAQQMVQSQTQAQAGTRGLSALQRAKLGMMRALAVYRAAEDSEAQVVHWYIEGAATQADLAEARRQTWQMERAYHNARLRYRNLAPSRKMVGV